MDQERIRAIWEAELEDLERTVISTERLVRGLETVQRGPWRPPNVPGSMPVDLADRALELLARQEAAAKALEGVLAQSQAHPVESRLMG